ncbi:MAG: hypothetical protein QM737_01385 [Ferruginibacter sp.]
MIDEFIDPDKWIILSVEDQLKISRQNSEEPTGKPSQQWRNSSKQISPLKLYSYLKVRFGLPNGMIMFTKKDSSDNLVHWHYAVTVTNAIINIVGKTSGVEIFIKTKTGIKITEADWQKLVDNFHNGFKKYSKEMKTIQSEFEQWALFINPFSRIEHTLKDYIYQLEKLNLKEVENYTTGSKESFKKYQKNLNRWANNIGKAASLGTTIRMLCPVMAESFINLILLLFRKEEYANDERLYEGLIREQIDIRVKTLHLHCTCFPKQIDFKSDAFKRFHTLMNKRNDFLHGNIDPNKLIVEDVWFDQIYTPLFNEDEGVIKKMMRNYCFNVEPEKAIEDFQTISNLIELVLMAMDDNSLKAFVQIMGDRMPGINKKTKRLGVLFGSQLLVEDFLGGE